MPTRKERDVVELERLIWERDGIDWPNRSASRFVPTAGFTWHVQCAGAGPKLLLLHGTGASTHSVGGLFERLQRHFTVLAPDLPGHGFTARARREDVSLAGMSRALDLLLAELRFSPAIVVGHSAGAAVLARLVLDGGIHPRLIVSLNGAFLPFSGIAGRVFSPMARLLAQARFVPQLVARRGRDREAVARVLAGTGSNLDERQVALYQRLFSNPAHVAATLDMMAQWDLAALSRDLPGLRVPLVLLACSDDEAVPAERAFAAKDLLPGARVVYRRGLGHLAHEERPEEIAAFIVEEAVRAHVVTAGAHHGD